MEYTAVVAISTALTQLLKKTLSIPSRFMPITSLIIGVIIGYSSGMKDIVMIITVGLTASGFYDVAKEPVKKAMKSIE